MKQQKTRELLITTKAAQTWQADFDQQVDKLMHIVSIIDSETNVLQASETMDIYQNSTRATKLRRKKIIQNERPFEFMVFRN